MNERDEMREMAKTLVAWFVAALAIAVLIALFAGCSFNLLPNGLWGKHGVESPTVQPPPVESPSGQGNGLPGDSVGKWEWLSDPALWGAVSVGVVYVGNQVRKSRKYKQ